MAALVWLVTLLTGPAPLWAPGPVLDQHGAPTCVATALLGWEEAGPGALPAWTLPSVPWVYGAAQARDGQAGPHEGTQTGAGWRALADGGYVLPDSMRWTADADTARLWLASGPWVLTTNWYDSMYASPPPGQPLPVVPSTRPARHALLCYGLLDHGRLLACQQSWGPAWGDHGRFTLRVRDLAVLLADGGDVSQAQKAPPGAE